MHPLRTSNIGDSKSYRKLSTSESSGQAPKDTRQYANFGCPTIRSSLFPIKAVRVLPITPTGAGAKVFIPK